LGFITNLLADRASAQQQNDGTLILTGSVQEQVTKGTGILIDEAYKAIDGLSEVGKTLEVLNAAKETAIKQAREVPVIGPLAQQVLDRLK
jgi:hypothetical protein